MSPEQTQKPSKFKILPKLKNSPTEKRTIKLDKVCKDKLPILVNFKIPKAKKMKIVFSKLKGHNISRDTVF